MTASSYPLTRPRRVRYRSNMKTHRVMLMCVVALVAGAATSALAADPVAKCRSAIVKGANELLIAHAKASAKCTRALILGKAPSCPDDRASVATAKAGAKLRSAIAKACGGKDKVCGGNEIDIGLLEIGWSIGSCDQTGSTSCFNPITDCNGVASCVACLAEQSVDDALAIFAARPVVVPKVEKVLAKCLVEVTTSSTNSFMKVAKSLGECWRNVSDLGSGGSFSCPNRAASIAAGKAKSSNVSHVCDACGNGKCGDGDDFAPAALGFPATCPAIGTCGGSVQTLQDLANCADCVSHALIDTAVRRTIPQFATAPPPCTP